jgi:hypothetical protein
MEGISPIVEDDRIKLFREAHTNHEEFEKKRILHNLNTENSIVTSISEGELDGLNAKEAFEKIWGKFSFIPGTEEWYLSRLDPQKIFDIDNPLLQEELSEEGYRTNDLPWNAHRGILGASSSSIHEFSKKIFDVTDSFIGKFANKLDNNEARVHDVAINLAEALILVHPKDNLNGRSIRLWQVWLEKQIFSNKDKVRYWRKCGIREPYDDSSFSQESRELFRNQSSFYKERGSEERALNLSLFSQLRLPFDSKFEDVDTALTKTTWANPEHRDLVIQGNRRIGKFVNSVVDAIDRAINNNDVDYLGSAGYDMPRESSTILYNIQELYRYKSFKMVDYRYIQPNEVFMSTK